MKSIGVRLGRQEKGRDSLGLDKKVNEALAMVGASSCALRGHRFYSQSGQGRVEHSIPVWGKCRRQPVNVSISHWWFFSFFFSLSHPLSPKQVKNRHILHLHWWYRIVHS